MLRGLVGAGLVMEHIKNERGHPARRVETAHHFRLLETSRKVVLRRMPKFVNAVMRERERLARIRSGKEGLLGHTVFAGLQGDTLAGEARRGRSRWGGSRTEFVVQANADEFPLGFKGRVMLKAGRRKG
jgi:hypothetical protein